MSQEHVEVVARSIDAFNRAFNRGDLEGFLEFVTPDIEWFPVMGAMDRDGSFRGRSGVEAYFDVLRDAWEDLAFAPGNEVRERRGCSGCARRQSPFSQWKLTRLERSMRERSAWLRLDAVSS